MGGSNRGRALCTFGHHGLRVRQCRSRCSTIGPSASAGMKVSAPTMITTPISMATNSGVCVGSVPGLAGTIFLRASEPAIASVGMASQ